MGSSPWPVYHFGLQIQQTEGFAEIYNLKFSQLNILGYFYLLFILLTSLGFLQIMSQCPSLQHVKNKELHFCMQGCRVRGSPLPGFRSMSWVEHSVGALLQPLESTVSLGLTLHTQCGLTGEVQVLEKQNEEATGEEEEGMSRRGGEDKKKEEEMFRGEKQEEQLKVLCSVK